MNTITVKLTTDQKVILEKTAVAALYPGYLLAMDSDDKVKPHNVAGGSVAPVMFAVEDDLQGNGIDDQYAVNDKVFCWMPRPGDEVYAILADGNNAVIGSKLESNGAGMLQLHTADDSDDPNIAEQLVAVAIEAVDTSDSSLGESSTTFGFNRRIKVRIV